MTEEIKDHSTQPTLPSDHVGDDPANLSDSSASSIGSLQDIDHVTEDINRDATARATGFMGKNSEVTWMQKLNSSAGRDSRKQTQASSGIGMDTGGKDATIVSTSYHLDDFDIRMPGDIDHFAVPPKCHADQLFAMYFDTVHGSFPIIRQDTFTAQYHRFFQASSIKPGKRWLAVLNMIFAIGSKYRQLVHGSEEALGDDLVYLNRARILSLNGDSLFAHSDLQQVQIEGLVSFYLLAAGQINRRVHQMLSLAIL